MPEVMSPGSASVADASMLAKPSEGCSKSVIFKEVVDDATKEQRICELRKLVEDCPNLNVRTDDLYMSRYLYATDWDVTKAMDRMLKLFKLKFDHPNYFVTQPLENYERIMNINCKMMLPKKDKHGRKVFVSKFSRVNPSVLSIQDLTVIDDLWFEILFDDVSTQRQGIAVIIDIQGYSWKMMKWLIPSTIKVLSTRADIVPARHFEVHIVNSSFFMNGALQIVFPVLSQDIKNVLHFHPNNFGTLHAFLGTECVPKEYGGDFDLNMDMSQEIINDHMHILQDLHKYTYIETNSDSKDKSKKKNKK